jgi:uncharacterized hydrophobic protein (TIGR00271 family)
MAALGVLVEAIRDSVVSEPEEDARAAIDELLPADNEEFVSYLLKFTMLIILSASIAAFGLLADSASVVIGAMLVAPLMTPITAVAGATVMAQNGRLVRGLLVIVSGIVGAIVVGYVTTLLAGTEISIVTELPGEVQARTFPDLLDLGIAVTAGAAAGYILPRRSTVAALPGVGIAVALVPPLATVGICARVGADRESANAFLLFATNFAAIVFSCSVMLILAGFRPRTEVSHRRLARRVAVSLLAVALIAVPLTLHTRDTLDDVSLSRSVTDALVAWDDSVDVIDMTAEVTDDRAAVELLVSGPNEARPAWRLATEIQSRFAGPVDLRLRYQRDQLYSVSVR